MAKKTTTAAKPTRGRKASAAERTTHKPPSIAEMAFQVVKRGQQFFVLNEHHVTVAGPFKSREAAMCRADEMETRAPR
jgi:hypothetical protein